MPELIPILEKNDIDNLVVQIANRISQDYQGREIILIGVLKGSFIFLSDLARYIKIPVKIDFIGASSYGSATASSGNIQLTKKVEINIKGKDILVVEDIIDTGLTLSYIVDYLKAFNPKTVKICALIDKRERRKSDIHIDYAGHIVEQGFLVGYGLDYNEDYRCLSEICHLKF